MRVTLDLSGHIAQVHGGLLPVFQLDKRDLAGYKLAGALLCHCVLFIGVLSEMLFARIE